MSRPFKITLGKGKSAKSMVVFADSKSIVDKHATALATEGKTSEVRPLNEAEYKTVDFASDSFSRVPGGKEDAVVTPFALTYDGETEYKLAPSPAIAERFLAAKIQEKAAFTVEPVPAEEYTSIDWANVETIEAPTKAAKSKDEDEGDSKKQVDMAGVPGL